MAGEDREKIFEQALARNLRKHAIGAPREVRSACADPETLAAYHERTLAPEEMSFWKEHIAGCPRCQGILAYVEETEGIEVDLKQEPRSMAVGAASVAARKATSVVELRSAPRRRAWIWAAPAGAIAAGLLVWVAVQSNKSFRFRNSEKVEVAENRPAPAPQVVQPPGSHGEAKPAAPEANSRMAAEYLKRQERPKPPDENAAAQREALAMRKKILSAPTARPAKPKGDVSAGDQNVVADQVARSEANAPLSPEDQKSLEAQQHNFSSVTTVNPGTAPAPSPPPPVPSASQTVEVASGQQETTTRAPVANTLAKAKSGAKAPAPQLEQQQQSQAVAGAALQSSAPVMRLANNRSPVTVTAPDGKVRWRIGAAGSIERADEGSDTWTLQKSGVVNDLLAGSAVSDKVCWVAGRLGTILRTTDGGANWVKLQAPVADDFTSVFAVSAQQATVSSARDIYETDDGGVTWSKIGAQ